MHHVLRGLSGFYWNMSGIGIFDIKINQGDVIQEPSNRSGPCYRGGVGWLRSMGFYSGRTVGPGAFGCLKTNCGAQTRRRGPVKCTRVQVLCHINYLAQ